MDLYRNDYLDAVEASADDPDEESDDEQKTHPGDEMSNWWFGQKKHKKHTKHNRNHHRHKHHKYRFWKKYDDKLHQDDNHSNLAGDPNDFNDIKNRILPNQQEDINAFIRNVNSAPQRFDFDVDAFVASNKRMADAASDASIASTEVASERSFYQFRPESIWASDKIQPMTLSKNPIEKRSRRDILTQHLKAIANKIHLYPSIENDPFRWTYQPQSDVFIDRKQVKSIGNTGDKDDNNFIDNFYLLNDGKPPAEPMPRKSAALADLDLDLELDRKFRDLNTSKNSAFYSAELEGNFNKQRIP